MELSFGKYSVRSFRKSDADSLARYADNYDVARYLRDSFPYPYGRGDAEGWIRFVHAQPLETNFAIAAEHEAIGGIGIRLGDDIHRVGAEIGYWLGEPFWGKGIMTEAVSRFTQYCFDNFTLERIWAGVFDLNRASARVLEKAGYVYEGTLRQAVIKQQVVMDELIYSALRYEWKSRFL